jgi:hypothetical protein
MKAQLGRGTITKKGTNAHSFAIDTLVGIADIIAYYDRFPAKTIKHHVRFLRVKSLLPYALDRSWKNPIECIEKMMFLNALMSERNTQP